MSGASGTSARLEKPRLPGVDPESPCIGESLKLYPLFDEEVIFVEGSFRSERFCPYGSPVQNKSEGEKSRHRSESSAVALR